MHKKGFSLIELIVVVLIVSILAAIAVPMYQGFVRRAQRSEAYAALGTIRTSERAYYIQYNGYLGIPFSYSGGEPVYEGEATSWELLGLENLSKPSPAGYHYGVYVIIDASGLWFYAEARNETKDPSFALRWLESTKKFSE
ncbi:MAG: prepilin-type N-terminal cleavage/methylation domain-containing protein [Candidatus Omnitrophica bacterium]|nr:prepilin-type N-terminal cleavage/methylation domain-containing protein [Candidatus Omnitrophota bacterium]